MISLAGTALFVGMLAAATTTDVGRRVRAHPLMVPAAAGSRLWPDRVVRSYRPHHAKERTRWVKSPPVCQKTVEAPPGQSAGSSSNAANAFPV